jgi:hypothetical protein
MSNQGKSNVSEGLYSFPVESIDIRILKEIYDLFERESPDPAHIAYIVTENWWKIIDDKILNLYSKKGLGFYYAIMVDNNYDLLSSGEDFGVDDITPVVAPAFEVKERAGMGSHRVGGLEDIQWIELEETFGLPTWENPYMGDSGEKIKVEWSIDFKDMGQAFIYDYKQYDIDPLDNTTWSVGGTQTEDFAAVLLSLYRKYGERGVVKADGQPLYEEIDTEIKYAIDQQYRNEPEKRKEILTSLEDDHIDDYYVGGYKELQFDVNPRELVNKLAEEKGYGRVVDEMLGGNGTAYFTSKGNVIKLTGDKSEYETANVIKGKNNKYIADVYESGKLSSSHIVKGEGYIVIMEELGLPKQMAEIFEECCCGVNKPIYIEHNETPVVIHPPVNGKEECEKLHKNLLMIRQELTQHGISWGDVGIDNLGMKNGKLALLDLGETVGGIDTGETIEINERQEKLNPNLGEDNTQEIVDKVYPHIVENLGLSKYLTQPPVVELHKDIYARLSGIPGSIGEESKSSEAQYDDEENKIFIYYPNMKDEEHIIRSLLHEYTHSLQDPDKRKENRKDGYENDPDEAAAAQAELSWKDYLVYLKDELHEQEQLELELPTPIGKFEFPVGYEDIHTETGEEYAGSEQETVDVIRDEVRDESVTYLFKKWDKTGIDFNDLKLIGIPSNNSLIRVMLVKRYLKNTMKSIPVSYTFDCEDLSKMFIKNARDYSVDYIEQFLCGEHEWYDYNNWYDHDWYDGMADDLDDRNWKTIMNILGVTTQDEAENIVNNRPQTEEEEKIAEEKEDLISEIRSSILWTHNDEAEWRTKEDMGDDVIDKLGEHFNNDGKLSRDDNGKWSWTIEDNLLNWLGDDMWDNIDLYEYHPDYAGYTLEDWLMDISGMNLPQAIFESLMLEEFTFEDYDYGKRGDLLEPEARFHGNYYHPNYDINDGLYDRLGEIEHYSSATVTQLDEEEQQMDVGEDGPFDRGELLILKHVHKNFTKQELQDLVMETPVYGNLSKKWTQLMKMFDIPTSSFEESAISTQYAKYALDNWNEEGDYTMEKPERDMIQWFDVVRDETGSQVEYRSGSTEVLAFDHDDADERGDNEFHDWDGEMDTYDWGDYETYDSRIEDTEPTGRYAEIPKISEGVDRHDKPYEFFTKIWDKHGPTLDAAVLKLYGVSDWSTGMLRRFLVDYLGGRKQIEKDIREMLPKVSDVVTCGGYEFDIFYTNVQVYEDGSIVLDTLVGPDGEVTLIETDWEGDPITLKLSDIANEDHWGMTKHPFRNPHDRNWDDGDYYEWEHVWGEVDHEIVDCITEHFSKEIGKRFGSLEINAEYQFNTTHTDLSEGVEGDQEWHTKEQGDFFTLDGSENLGNTDIFKDDGFDIIHQYRGDVHLSDLSPEESETAIPQGSKKVKKTVLKPRLDKGPFNIPVPMKEHYEDVESNPDLNPEVEEGDIIELLYMDDPYSIPIKTKGVVMGFEGKPGDFAYKILVNWIMGPEKLSPMALLPDADVYRFPKKKKGELNEQWEKPYKDPKAVINGREMDLDVADTEFMKQKGMMYKTSYPKNRGMLFLWDDIVPISMWMKNTFLPLDIIYMVNGEVVDYDKDVQPCEEQQCDTYGNVNANQVLELLSGGVDNYNISIGDQIELMDIE